MSWDCTVASFVQRGRKIGPDKARCTRTLRGMPWMVSTICSARSIHRLPLRASTPLESLNGHAGITGTELFAQWWIEPSVKTSGQFALPCRL